MVDVNGRDLESGESTKHPEYTKSVKGYTHGEFGVSVALDRATRELAAKAAERALTSMIG